jgi:hypothetical protein
MAIEVAHTNIAQHCYHTTLHWILRFPYSAQTMVKEHTGCFQRFKHTGYLILTSMDEECVRNNRLCFLMFTET